MKTSKRLVTFVSLVVISSFLFGAVVSASSDKNPFNQLWEAIFDLQTQVDELEASSGTTRTVIEVSIDLEADGDVITYEYSDFLQTSVETHWKRIEAPQIELDDMPLVQIFSNTTYPEIGVGDYPNFYYMQDGYLYIFYKTVRIPDANPVPEIEYYNSDYTIVIVK